MVVAVVLRDRDDLHVGVLAEVSQHLGGDQLLDSLVGDAHLGVTIQTPAADLAEVLRMLLEVLCRRDQHGERVYEEGPAVPDLAAVLFLQTLGVAVGFVVRRPVAVKGVHPERFPVLQRRHVATCCSGTVRSGRLGMVLTFEDHQRQPTASSRKE